MVVPDSPLSRSLDAAVGYFELGMVEDALEELRRLPAEFRNESEVLELEVAIGHQIGNWELAAASMETLCRQPCATVDQFIEWGCCLYELGRVPECRAALLQAPACRDRHALWNFHLACYESILGPKEEARRRIEQALQLDPGLRRMAAANLNLAPLLPATGQENLTR